MKVIESGPEYFFSRRRFLRECGLGMGGLALASLLHSEGLLAGERAPERGMDLRPKPSHFPAQVKAVIQLVQDGGPSQVDLLDPKPELAKRNGQKLPANTVESFQPGSETQTLLASPFKFHRRGQCGMEMCEHLPHLGTVADELCLIRSMFSENNNHPEAQQLMLTGKIFPGRPTLGAWVSYALGTESQNLPAYVVLLDPEGPVGNGSRLWDNGWLPALYRGTELHSRGAAAHDLRPAVPRPQGVQRNNLELLAKLNERHRRRFPLNSELEARIRNYELAARMQLTAERLLDLSRESSAIKRLYGLDNPITASYGQRCLMARRLVETGVRFVQVFCPVGSWDTHSTNNATVKKMCEMTDQPTAALIKDLKSRGLLESTLVIWAGEFGRLPISQNKDGRDHDRHACSIFLAGGGFKAGHVHGATDDFGYKAVENRVSFPDLLATILCQLGLDQDKLTYVHNGIEETLTDAKVSKAQVRGELLRASGGV